MGLKSIIKRFVYPNSYSSDALIRHIRAGGYSRGKMQIL